MHGVGAWDAARTVIALCERALQLLPEADARRRALLLARLSAALTETVDPPRGAALSLEALRAAEAVGDPVAELEAIAARHLAITVPQSVDERERLARRACSVGSAGIPDGGSAFGRRAGPAEARRIPVLQSAKWKRGIQLAQRAGPARRPNPQNRRRGFPRTPPNTPG